MTDVYNKDGLTGLYSDFNCICVRRFIFHGASVPNNTANIRCVWGPAAIYDVESIEVLKGTRGTLFGRNTEGGAVNITTEKPSGKFKLSATVGAGNYGAGKGEVHFDLLSWRDISVKVDGLITRRDGTVTNSGGNDFNAYDRHGVHAQAMWRPNDRLTTDYSFDISRDATMSMYVQLLDFVTLAAKYPKASLARPNRADASDYGVQEQFSVGNTNGHRLTVDYTVSPSITLKSISAYRGLVQTQYDNGGVDTSPSFFAGPPYSTTSANVGRYSLANFNQNQYSRDPSCDPCKRRPRDRPGDRRDYGRAVDARERRPAASNRTCERHD